MKSKTLLLATMLVGSIPGIGFAQYTSSQAVTFVLTDTYTAPALPAKNENGSPARDESGKPYFVYEQS